MARRRPPIKIMVSSTVYGFESQLRQVEGILRGYRYDVIMSPSGTVRWQAGRHNFDACLRAVGECDVFLGIIRGTYGSGRAPGDLSITHQEIQQAINLNKPRLFAVDERVNIARQILRPLLEAQTKRGRKLWSFPTDILKRNPIINDIRILDMYEEALLSETPLMDRTDHWCQTYRDDAELFRFLKAQFRDKAKLRNDLDELSGNGGGSN